MKHLATILLILLSALSAHAGSQGARAPFSENPTVSNVKVRLYSANTIKQLNISIDLGHYNLYATDNGSDELLEDMIGDGRSIILRSEGKKVHVSVNETDYGTFKSVRLETADTACILCLNPANCKQRTYEGNLEISTLKNGNLLILNDVEFETYIAGVVQSEIYGNQTDNYAQHHLQLNYTRRVNRPWGHQINPRREQRGNPRRLHRGAHRNSFPLQLGRRDSQLRRCLARRPTLLACC